MKNMSKTIVCIQCNEESVEHRFAVERRGEICTTCHFSLQCNQCASYIQYFNTKCWAADRTRQKNGYKLLCIPCKAISQKIPVEVLSALHEAKKTAYIARLTHTCTSCGHEKVFTSLPKLRRADEICAICKSRLRFTTLKKLSNSERKVSKAWSAGVKNRDKHVCVSCGITENLHAHHILQKCSHPFLAAQVSNGVTLCADCHVGVAGVHGTSEPCSKLVHELRSSLS